MCILFNRFAAIVLCAFAPFLACADNMIPGDSSFEAGPGDLLSDGAQTDSSPKNVKCVIEEQGAVDGARCAKLTFSKGDFVRGVFVTVPPALDGKVFTFSIFAKSEKNGVKGSLNVYRTDFKNKFSSGFTLTDEWRRHSASGALPAGDYFFRVGIHTPGAVWLDAFQFENAAEPSAYRNNAELCAGVSIPGEGCYVFSPGERIPAEIFVSWPEGFSSSGLRLLFEVSDWKGACVLRHEEAVKPAGRNFKTEREFAPTVPGWYCVRVKLFDGAKLASESLRTVSVVDAPVEIEPGRLPFCGMCWSFNGSGRPVLGADKIGARWVEVPNFHWRDAERRKGDYKWVDISGCVGGGRRIKFPFAHLPSAPEWSWDQAEVADCKRMGLTASGFGFLPARLDDWRDFVRAFAAHYKGQVDIVEFGGEDDLTFGDNAYYKAKYPEHVKRGKLVAGPAYERYVEMLKIGCEEIRKVDPNVKIGIVRPSGGDCPGYAFASPAIGACKDMFDLLPLDCYCSARYIGPEKPATPVPEDFLPNYLNNALESCRTNGRGQHVYISEIGYALDYNLPPDGHYAMEMVKRLARMHLTARMTPGVDALHWFTPNICVESRRYFYGLWRFGLPLPTVSAYSAVARVVENVDESKELVLGGDSKAVVFRKRGRADAAVWFVHDGGRLLLAGVPEGLSITDVMGAPVDGSSKSLEMGEFPVYFGLKGPDAFDAICKMLSQSKMICKPVKLAFVTQRGDAGTLQVRNLLGADLEAKLSVSLDGSAVCDRTLKLKRGELRMVEIPLARTPAEVKASVDCGGALEKVEASYPVSFERCAKIKSPGKVDGDLSKWAGRPCILMNERGQVMPPDPWIDYKGPEHFSAKVYLGWDADNLYVAADVRDDVHSNKFPDAIWKGDCLQFAVDPRADATGLDSKGGYGKDDVEMGMALTSKGLVVTQWIGGDMAARDAEYAVKRDEAAKRTFYEMRIPFLSLGMAPVPGAAFGFNFVIPNDDIGAGAGYWYQLTPGVAGEKNPALFKRFVLEE